MQQQVVNWIAKKVCVTTYRRQTVANVRRCILGYTQLGTKHMAPPGGATSKRRDCLVSLLVAPLTHLLLRYLLSSLLLVALPGGAMSCIPSCTVYTDYCWWVIIKPTAVAPASSPGDRGCAVNTMLPMWQTAGSFMLLLSVSIVINHNIQCSAINHRTVSDMNSFFWRNTRHNNNQTSNIKNIFPENNMVVWGTLEVAL